MSRESDILQYVAKPIEQYEELTGAIVDVDIAILDECFQKVDESMERIFASADAPDGYDLSTFKIAGVVCFWLRKLKPFSVVSDTGKHRFVNEYLAFTAGYFLIFDYQELGKKPRITGKYLTDIVGSFRYNSHSPNSTALIFESLCI